MADKVAGLLFMIRGDTSSMVKTFKKTEKSVSSIKKSFNALGPIIAAAFSVRAVANFTKEIIRLTGEAQGVIEAFNRLPDSAKLLDDLKIATRGTVSEVKLMQMAVMMMFVDLGTGVGVPEYQDLTFKMNFPTK